MTENNFSIRDIEKNDFEKIVDYFLKADKNFLEGMGVDTTKLPRREEWLKVLSDDFKNPLKNKKFFFVIWLLDKMPVGHSNINKIVFGEEAYMHLHLWHAGARQKGIGLEFIKMTLPWYFDRFKLKKLYCEPYAFNPAPNKIMQKLGFDFIKQYETVPGWINLHQLVNMWCLDRDKYQLLYG